MVLAEAVTRDRTAVGAGLSPAAIIRTFQRRAKVRGAETGSNGSSAIEPSL